MKKNRERPRGQLDSAQPISLLFHSLVCICLYFRLVEFKVCHEQKRIKWSINDYNSHTTWVQNSLMLWHPIIHFPMSGWPSAMSRFLAALKQLDLRGGYSIREKIESKDKQTMKPWNKQTKRRREVKLERGWGKKKGERGKKLGSWIAK